MSKVAVHMVWTLTSTGVDVEAREHEFAKRIVPGVQMIPGFVQGIFTRTEDGSRSNNTVVFEDRHGAEALIAQMEGNMPDSEAAGVHLESLDVLDVVISV